MQYYKYHDTTDQSGRRPWHPRSCIRRAVTLRVDYATADGRGWLGVVRNLSLQGMYIDSALRHVAHEVAPGTLLMVAFMLPSGRPCKLRAIVIHDDRRGCSAQFLEGSPFSLAHLAHYGLSLDAEDDR
jgi:PilZ domain